MKSSGLILFVCAGLLFSGGAILSGSTAWGLLRISYYFWTSDLGVELACSVLYIIGALLCLPACWLATLVPYQPKSVTLIATLVALTTVAMLMLSLGLSSMTGLSRVVRDPTVLNASMLRAMASEPYDPSVRNAFAAMQLELKCCGVHSYTDWYKHRSTLPPACCGRVWNGKRREKCTEPIYAGAGGCLRVSLTELRRYADSLSALASAIVLVLGLTMFTVVYILVTNMHHIGHWNLHNHERREAFKTPQSLRIACLASHPPPLISYTSPAALPNTLPQIQTNTLL